MHPEGFELQLCVVVRSQALSPCVVARRESDPSQSLAHPGSSVVGEGHQEHHRGPGDWGREQGSRGPANQELQGERQIS